jgi:hypothetical protein
MPVLLSLRRVKQMVSCVLKICRMLTRHSLSSHYTKGIVVQWRIVTLSHPASDLRLCESTYSCKKRKTNNRLVCWCASNCSAHLGPRTHYIDQDVTRSTDLQAFFAPVSFVQVIGNSSRTGIPPSSRPKAAPNMRDRPVYRSQCTMA